MNVYVPVNLDYDDYLVGSPGPIFSNMDEAIAHAKKKHYDTVREEYVWKSDEQYDEWLTGMGRRRSKTRELLDKLRTAGLRG